MATVAENREQLLARLARVGISLPTHKWGWGHYHLQRDLAPLLRAAAIEHLRSVGGLAAHSLRETYIFVAGTDGFPQEAYADFLDEQAKRGVCSTSYEAIALGELLDINIILSDRSSEPVVRYKAGEDRPVMNLYLIKNDHWSLDPRDETKILDDGNCLYNATTTWLQRVFTLRAAAPSKSALADSAKALHTSWDKAFDPISWDKAFDRIITNVRQDTYIQSLIQEAKPSEDQLKLVREFRGPYKKITEEEIKEIQDKMRYTRPT